jgi:hypothetical protein
MDTAQPTTGLTGRPANAAHTATFDEQEGS